MEAEVGDRRRHVIRRGEVALQPRLVDVDEGGAISREEVPHLGRVPGGVAELGRRWEARNGGEDPLETQPVLGRVVKGEGELRQDAAEPPLSRQGGHGLREGFLFGGTRLPFVREAAEELGREREPRVVRDASCPIGGHARRRDPVERGRR